MDGIPRTHEGNLLHRNLLNIRIIFIEIVAHYVKKSLRKVIRQKNDGFVWLKNVFNTKNCNRLFTFGGDRDGDNDSIFNATHCVSSIFPT